MNEVNPETAVFVDQPIFGKNGGWCHMWSPSREALIKMADAIGLKRDWIQEKRTNFVHYDLVRSKRELAIQFGAIPVDTYQLICMRENHENGKGICEHWEKSCPLVRFNYGK